MGKVTTGPRESSGRGTQSSSSASRTSTAIPSSRRRLPQRRVEAAQAREVARQGDGAFLYHFGESTDAQGRPVWGTTAAGACAIPRERYQRDAANTAAAEIPIQVSVEYSDGRGNVP